MEYNVKDAHEIFSPQKNSSHYIPPSTAEGALLFLVALLGGLGNALIMAITLMCPSLRQMSSAFLFHHCLLDTVKSGFCIPFGYSLLLHSQIAHCDLLGAGYILLMTVSAYNLLALLVNEEYQCSSASKGNYPQNGDGCCIAFGIVITWFTTVLLHLGVAFLPGSSEFSHDVGNCVYRYGVTKNYVIHVLWVILVTGAIVVAGVSFFHFFRKLRISTKSRKWTFLHKSLSSLSTQNITSPDLAQEIHYEFDEPCSQKAVHQSRRYMRRIMVMMAMLVSFVICWYPLFLLTLLDVHYKQPAHFYRLLMILAWAHPLTTPIFCGIIYYEAAKGERAAKEMYTNALPLTVSRSGDMLQQEINQRYRDQAGLGFHNDNFQILTTPEGVPPAPPDHNHQHQSTSSPCPQSSSFYSHQQCALTNLPGDATTPQDETIMNLNAEKTRCQTLIM